MSDGTPTTERETVTGDITSLTEVELPMVTLQIRLRRTTPPLQWSSTPCACGSQKLEGQDYCGYCDIPDINDAMVPVDKTSALSLLARYAQSDDVEDAHLAADQVLLKLIGDREIAEAFYRIPKWYA